MARIFRAGVFAAAASLLAAPAFASSFSFADLANETNATFTAAYGSAAVLNEGSWESRVSEVGVAGGDFDAAASIDGVSGVFTVAGIGVSASAGRYDSTVAVADRVDVGDTSAYLDKDSGGRPAGLGAAQTSTLKADPAGNLTQANPGSDDNTGLSGGPSSGSVFMEFVELHFDVAVSLVDLTLFDNTHVALEDGEKIGISKGGLDFVEYIVGTTDLSTFGRSENWLFAKIDGGESFYVNTLVVTDVPIPAAGLLLIGGLGALGFVRRQRKSS